jgi:hypothetical protein
MTTLVMANFSLQDIFGIFVSTIYDKHSSLIDAQEFLNVSEEKIVEVIAEIDFRCHDDFICTVYESLNINDYFFPLESACLSVEEHSINDKNFESINLKVIGIVKNFDSEVVDLTFSSKGQKLVFKNYFNYFADRLGGGG